MKKGLRILVITLTVLSSIGLVFIVFMMNQKYYTDKFSSEELYNTVADSFFTEGEIHIFEKNDVILEYADEDLPYLIDCIVVKAKNAKNINEIGIFKVKDGNAKEMNDLVDKYLTNLQESYRAMDYFPEEIEKIDLARTKIFGNYVVYSFLDEKDTANFYSSLEKVLRE